MPTLLSPLALIALSALAIPLLIHLVRRRDREVHIFAALRWLQLRSPQPRLRWREPLLLALRLLLVATLALLLASPVLRGGHDAAPAWALVAPGIAPETAQAEAGADYELHWLAPNWPKLQDAQNPPPLDGATLSSLIREAADHVPAAQPLLILLPKQLAGLDAQRIELGREVEWRVLPGRSPMPDDDAVDAASVAPKLNPALPAGPDEPLSPPLLPLAALLWLAERWLATARVKGAA